jgi:hypothetical protein
VYLCFFFRDINTLCCVCMLMRRKRRKRSFNICTYITHDVLKIPNKKVRSIGAYVYAGDQIQLQCVKYPQLRLGVHPNNTPTVQATNVSSNVPKLPALSNHPTSRGGGAKGIPSLIRPSALLKNQGVGEVHGTIDVYGSFVVDLYYRPTQLNYLLTGNYFRLYHPEANGINIYIFLFFLERALQIYTLLCEDLLLLLLLLLHTLMHTHMPNNYYNT